MDAFVDWLQSEDFFFIKYGLIISNFVTMAFIVVMKSVKGKKADIEVKNVLLVTAHPDDESMFFLPTIQALKKQHYEIHLLCLSNGNFGKQGKLREDELAKCCKYLGIKKFKVVDDPELQDGMDTEWSVEKAVGHIREYSEGHEIKGIITFDGYGVSGHVNHVAVHKAVAGMEGVKKLYLESTNLVRKYIGVWDFFVSAVYSDELLVQVNPVLAWRCMAKHESQFVWYRKLFVVFSRYAYVNTLRSA